MRHYLVCIAILGFVAPTALSREWTDSTGCKTVEAEFIRVENEIAYFQLADGTDRACRLDRLCNDDRRAIEESAAAALPTVHFVAKRSPGETSDNADESSAATSTAESAGPSKSFHNLGFRRTAVPAPLNDPADKAFFKLTGWSRCTPWYCCDVNTCHPHVPCPPQVDYGKRIFKGCKCTFHLVSATGSSAPIPKNGTVAYEFYDKNGCCHRYLAYLTYNTSGGPWVVYAADGSPGGVSHWLINFTGLGTSCSHEVRWWNGSGWVPYDWTCREIPE